MRTLTGKGTFLGNQTHPLSPAEQFWGSPTYAYINLCRMTTSGIVTHMGRGVFCTGSATSPSKREWAPVLSFQVLTLHLHPVMQNYHIQRDITYGKRCCHTEIRWVPI